MSGSIGEIELFLAAVTGDNAEVVSLPSLIALFGGPIQSNSEFDAGIPAISRRDAFLHWVRLQRPELWSSLLVPEFYEDWNHFDNYQDLLEFEADLAYLTSAILIFLEGPGAIAELGAFSQIRSLKEKLVVVVTDAHHEKRSFISLGPLRQLDLREEDQVCVIPERTPAELLQDIGVIERVLNPKLQSNRSRGAFNPQSRAHQFALVLDLISISEVATFTDIKSALPHFRVALNEPALRQILFTLRRANQIHARRYGGTYYYLPVQRRQKWLDYRGAGEQFNRSRITAKILGRRQVDSDRAKVHELVYIKGGHT